MGYSDDPNMVRVDFFKVRENGHIGKWYCTEAVKWTGAWEGDNQGIFDAFRQALREHFGAKPRLAGMVAVCLKPYHEHKHPLVMHVDELE